MLKLINIENVRQFAVKSTADVKIHFMYFNICVFILISYKT